MDPKKLFIDDRFRAHCIYRGKFPSTRDHLPPRVMLDKPYPDNLSQIWACFECNKGFSADEMYLAAVVECARLGTVNIDLLKEKK